MLLTHSSAGTLLGLVHYGAPYVNAELHVPSQRLHLSIMNGLLAACIHTAGTSYHSYDRGALHPTTDGIPPDPDSDHYSIGPGPAEDVPTGPEEVHLGS